MYLFIVYHINSEKQMWERISFISISASRAKCSKMVLNEVRTIS